MYSSHIWEIHPYDSVRQGSQELFRLICFSHLSDCLQCNAVHQCFFPCNFLLILSWLLFWDLKQCLCIPLSRDPGVQSFQLTFLLIQGWMLYYFTVIHMIIRGVVYVIICSTFHNLRFFKWETTNWRAFSEFLLYFEGRCVERIFFFFFILYASKPLVILLLLKKVKEIILCN